jgi:hypothetical protein
VVPGCPRLAENNLSIRLRRPDTSAIWAPNLDAYVCDSHAVSGALLTLLFEPTSNGMVETVVHGVSTDAPRRETEIKRPAKKLLDDLREGLQKKVSST